MYRQQLCHQRKMFSHTIEMNNNGILHYIFIYRRKTRRHREMCVMTVALPVACTRVATAGRRSIDTSVSSATNASTPASSRAVADTAARDSANHGISANT